MKVADKHGRNGGMTVRDTKGYMTTRVAENRVAAGKQFSIEEGLRKVANQAHTYEADYKQPTGPII